MPQFPNALIFLLDEDLDEALLIQTRLIRAGIRNPIFALRDFSDAKQHLGNFAQDQDWPRVSEPHLALIALDPHGKALDFLRWLRTEYALSRVTVFVLADHNQSTAIQEAVELGASEVHFKGSNFEVLAASVRHHSHFSPSPALSLAPDLPRYSPSGEILRELPELQPPRALLA